MEEEDDSIVGGEVAEWLNAAVLRTVTLIKSRRREFESCPLRPTSLLGPPD